MDMDISNIYQKAVGWYSGLPLWKKIVFFLFVIVLLLLGIVYVVYRILSGGGVHVRHHDSDTAHTVMVDNEIAKKKAAQEKREEELATLKRTAAHLAKVRIQDTEKQRDFHEKINSASSFEEVDALLKGLQK